MITRYKSRSGEQSEEKVYVEINLVARVRLCLERLIISWRWRYLYWMDSKIIFT